MGGILAGAGGGLLSGLLGQQKEGSKDTGNAYGGAVNAAGGAQGLGNAMNQEMNTLSAYQGDPTKELQNNGVLGGLFGQGGTMDRTNSEEQRLANTGYQLTPEDHEAYGQASGDIARMFGQNDQSLAQALSDRGLSNSGAAGAAFSGSLGNKQEQLAGLQTKIANDRMKMNMERLGQTRNFLSQLGGQAQSGINEMQQLGRQKQEDINNVNKDKYNMQAGLLGKYQDQQNEGLAQQQQTQHQSGLSAAFNGAMGGGMTGAQMDSGMSGMSGGTKMAGQSSNNKMFA